MRRRGGRAGRMDVPRFRGWSCPKEKPMSDARTARAESIRALSIPAELLPGDGRFGSGPSRIRDAQMEVLADRKSTRLNSSHVAISYAVFCLKKKKIEDIYI